MATGKEQLSDLKIKAWIKAGEGDVLHDGGGLYLRRRDGGFYWSLRQTNPTTGARTWAALLPGLSYPEASLRMARTEADKGRLLATQHTDVVTERKASIQRAKDEAAAVELERQRRVTVRALFDRWCEVDLQPRTGTDGKRVGRKDGGAYTRAQFDRHVFPAIGDLVITDVRRSDLQALFDLQKAAGKLRTATVLYSDIKQLFRFALVRELIERHPLDAVAKRDVGGPAVERERVLSADELKALVRALPAANLTTKAQAAVWLILATGCRVGELMGTAWADVKADRATLDAQAEAADVKLGFVDLEKSSWHMPTTKNERPHTIHLSPFAVAQFRRLSALREVDEAGALVPWIFPAPDRKEPGEPKRKRPAHERLPVDKKTLGKQLSDRQREPGSGTISRRGKESDALRMPGGKWTPHDLRRTAATVMTRLGFSGDVVDEALNHMIESRVRRTYVRDRREAEQAQAFEALGRYLDELNT